MFHQHLSTPGRMMSFEQLGPACILCMLKLQNNCSYRPSHYLGGGGGNTQKAGYLFRALVYKVV